MHHFDAEAGAFPISKKNYFVELFCIEMCDVMVT
jgi:hypothetical protein